MMTIINSLLLVDGSKLELERQVFDNYRGHYKGIWYTIIDRQSFVNQEGTKRSKTIHTWTTRILIDAEDCNRLLETHERNETKLTKFFRSRSRHKVSKVETDYLSIAVNFSRYTNAKPSGRATKNNLELIVASVRKQIDSYIEQGIITYLYDTEAKAYVKVK